MKTNFAHFCKKMSVKLCLIALGLLYLPITNYLFEAFMAKAYICQLGTKFPDAVGRKDGCLVSGCHGYAVVNASCR